MNEDSWPRHKRFRGAKRYYEKLAREARSFSYSLREGEWYEMHHHHFDFFGHGRRGVKHHRAHLNALFTAFRRVLADVRLSGRPAQVFVYIAPHGSPEGDALFIHTPNPHGTFPHDFDGVEWDVPPPAYLREFISEEAWQVGAAQPDKERWHFIRERVSPETWCTRRGRGGVMVLDDRGGKVRLEATEG